MSTKHLMALTALVLISRVGAGQELPPDQARLLALGDAMRYGTREWRATWRESGWLDASGPSTILERSEWMIEGDPVRGPATWTSCPDGFDKIPRHYTAWREGWQLTANRVGDFWDCVIRPHSANPPANSSPIFRYLHPLERKSWVSFLEAVPIVSAERRANGILIVCASHPEVMNVIKNKSEMFGLVTYHCALELVNGRYDLRQIDWYATTHVYDESAASKQISNPDVIAGSSPATVAHMKLGLVRRLSFSDFVEFGGMRLPSSFEELTREGAMHVSVEKGTLKALKQDLPTVSVESAPSYAIAGKIVDARNGRTRYFTAKSFDPDEIVDKLLAVGARIAGPPAEVRRSPSPWIASAAASALALFGVVAWSQNRRRRALQRES